MPRVERSFVVGLRRVGRRVGGLVGTHPPHLRPFRGDRDQVAHEVDTPLLIDHFIGRFNRLQKKDVVSVSGQVLAALMNHDYPGNAREMEYIIEHAFVLCRGGLIELQHLPPEFVRGRRAMELAARPGMTLRSLESLHIADALRRSNGNRNVAAEELGIHPSTLFRKIKDLGIETPEKDGRSRKE